MELDVEIKSVEEKGEEDTQEKGRRRHFCHNYPATVFRLVFA